MKKTLSEIQEKLALLMATIDDMDEIDDATIDEFMSLNKERTEKIDAWIAVRDRLTSYLQEKKAQKERAVKAYEHAGNALKTFNNRLKYHMENDKTSKLFVGTTGTVTLQNSPKKLDHSISVQPVSLNSIVNDEFDADLCQDYLTEQTYMVLDTAKLKKDLQSGVEVPWAKLEQGKHVRVR